MVKKYIVPEIKITMFSDDAVITASTLGYWPDRDDPIELPFIPAK